MSEILAPIVNFSVVVFIVVYFGRKPFAQFLATRSDTIANQLQEAQKNANVSAKDLQNWESKWKHAQSEAQKQLEDAKSAFSRQKEEVLGFAQKEAERIQREAKMVANTEASKVAGEVQTEFVERSVHLVSDYFSHKLEAAPREKLVSEFVELINGSAR